MLVAPLLEIVGDVETINGQSIRVIGKDADGNVDKCSGTVVVTDGGAGYAKSCIYVKKDVGAGDTGLYENVGTTTACQFELITDTAPNEIDLANGKVLEGGVDGKAHEKTLGVSSALTGAPLSGHDHSIAAQTEKVSAVTKTRLYTGTVGGAGTGLIIGSTLAQAITLATAVVTHVGTGYVDVDTITGTFDATNIVTSTNPDTTHNTFTPPMTLVDVWTLGQAVASIMVVESNDGTALKLKLPTSLLTTGFVRLVSPTDLETLAADARTSVAAQFTNAATDAVSAGTPAGSVASTPTFS